MCFIVFYKENYFYNINMPSERKTVEATTPEDPIINSHILFFQLNLITDHRKNIISLFLCVSILFLEYYI